jgi:hypothetical protein
MTNVTTWLKVPTSLSSQSPGSGRIVCGSAADGAGSGDGMGVGVAGGVAAAGVVAGAGDAVRVGCPLSQPVSVAHPVRSVDESRTDTATAAAVRATLRMGAIVVSSGCVDGAMPSPPRHCR